jgi:Flp pilus assembly protein TadG
VNHRAGQSLIETTLIIVAFFGLLFGVVDVGQKLVLRETLTDRVRAALRWGALNPYDEAAIRNMVLYGAAEPQADNARFFGLYRDDVVVHDVECPGSACRVTVAVASHGIEMTSPVEPRD